LCAEWENKIKEFVSNKFGEYLSIKVLFNDVKKKIFGFICLKDENYAKKLLDDLSKDLGINGSI
jgi:hypothetical protein